MSDEKLDFPMSSTDRLPGYDGIVEEVDLVCASGYTGDRNFDQDPLMTAVADALEGIIEGAKGIDADGIIRVTCQVVAFPNGNSGAIAMGTAVKKPPLL